MNLVIKMISFYVVWPVVMEGIYFVILFLGMFSWLELSLDYMCVWTFMPSILLDLCYLIFYHHEDLQI